jgi:hypothetical protein
MDGYGGIVIILLLGIIVDFFGKTTAVQFLFQWRRNQVNGSIYHSFDPRHDIPLEMLLLLLLMLLLLMLTLLLMLMLLLMLLMLSLLLHLTAASTSFRFRLRSTLTLRCRHGTSFGVQTPPAELDDAPFIRGIDGNAGIGIGRKRSVAIVASRGVTLSNSSHPRSMIIVGSVATTAMLVVVVLMVVVLVVLSILQSVMESSLLLSTTTTIFLLPLLLLLLLLLLLIHGDIQWIFTVLLRT